MILEAIVTTLDDAGRVNIAPMGPQVEAEDFRRFVLKPYPTSHTYQNLKRHGEGVLHVTDDVLLLAKAAVGQLEPQPALIPATHVRGQVLKDACRFYEFRVLAMEYLGRHDLVQVPPSTSEEPAETRAENPPPAPRSTDSHASQIANSTGAPGGADPSICCGTWTRVLCQSS